MSTPPLWPACLAAERRAVLAAYDIVLMRELTGDVLRERG
jgi:hypothetical protein